MFTTPSITEIDTGLPGVHGFRIRGTVTRDDMTAMAEHVNGLFDRYPKIDMLLVFDGYEGSDTGAGLSWENLKSRVRALGEVRNYVVAGAPAGAEDMIRLFDKLIPVDARAFDTAEHALAWLRTEPPLAS